VLVLLIVGQVLPVLKELVAYFSGERMGWAVEEFQPQAT